MSNIHEKKAEWIEELSEMDGTDQELEHIRADSILCEFLEEIGCKDLADAFSKVDKWYS